MTTADCYRLLNLPLNADISELKKAFREKAKRTHPDVNASANAEEEFVQVHTAYETVLEHLQGKINPRNIRNTQEEYEERKQNNKARAERYARMKYEKFQKECDAYRNSPYAWIFKILYYGLYYLYMLCAMVFAMVPIGAGYTGGIFYFAVCSPLFVIAYFTVGMANDWRREIEPLFN